MTLQDLKNNRQEIITFIESRNYDLKFAMQMAVELASNCDSVEELTYELINYCQPVKIKSKNAEILGRLEQIEIENN